MKKQMKYCGFVIEVIIEKIIGDAEIALTCIRRQRGRWRLTEHAGKSDSGINVAYGLLRELILSTGCQLHGMARTDWRPREKHYNKNTAQIFGYRLWI